MPRGERHQVAQNGLGLLLRHVMAVGQRGGQVFQGDGCRSLHRSSLLRRGGSLLGWRHDDVLHILVCGEPARSARIRATCRTIAVACRRHPALLPDRTAPWRPSGDRWRDDRVSVMDWLHDALTVPDARLWPDPTYSPGR